MPASHDVTDFDRQVLARSHQVPVLVDFWAAWCGPCRMLGPVLERMAATAGGRWELAKLDTEAYPDIAGRYAIRSIPAVKLFVNGEVVDEFVGALPERDIRQFLDAALPSPLRDALARAQHLLAQGAWTDAAAAARTVVAAAPDDTLAHLTLAEALLHADPGAVEAALGAMPEDDAHADAAEALRTLARLAIAAPGLEAGGPAERAVAAAGAAIRTADWETAFAALVRALEHDRGAVHGAAREGARVMVRLLGTGHPAIDRHWRAFTAVMGR